MGRLFARLTFIPTLLYNIALEQASVQQWYNSIDPRIILGALPLKHMCKKLVEKENVKAVVSMNEDYELKWLSNMHKEWNKLGVKFLQLSTVDLFEAPSQIKLQQGVKFIKDFEKESHDGRVYVHCKAGRTRSATLVACYLMDKYRWTPQQAVDHLIKTRPQTYLRSRQHEAIQLYHQELVKQGKCPPSDVSSSDSRSL
ncbi:hypothetical protein Pmani_024484 [Petrolisthes manimaculis]|uniref:Phosphatidylglycerophosphatase and protein-tyrosine phosphatase 1 n=1 Tax=Petrolisthes manimaculis TaxID=1843537 RepID=A0AAE1PA86_9EUCA|nr:hypothetical protein Pmani_024484 [Petrolisthes manimaculis]